MSEEKKSSKTGCIVVAVVVLLVVGVAFVLLTWLALRSVGKAASKVSRGTVLELSLSGSWTEGPSEYDLGLLFGTTTRSLWDLRRTLNAAAEDPDIVGLRLVAENAGAGWSTAEEILEYVDHFRESGKPVHAQLAGDMVSDVDYFLATGADRIWIMPETAAVINGVAAEVQFYRGSLDKLHVEPQVLMYKEYKSAGEPYVNYGMSEYMRESMTAVLASIHDRFLDRVALRRGVERDRVEAFLARGMTTAADLLEMGLVDEIGYRDQVTGTLAEAAGVDEYRGVSFAAYRQSLGKESRGRRRIAIVYGEGPIVTSTPDTLFPFALAMFSGSRVAANIQAAADDPRVKAIVFRVNSPGGSAVGSDLVRRAIVRVRAQGTPVVVSMSDVAGSGGYWVAMAADAIVAHSTTMTGSIGVVFTKFNLDGFFEWLGTNTDRITTSPAADMFGTGPLEDAELEGVRSWMDATYDSFTSKVAESRDLDLEHVQEIARGRVWSGRDALALDLVDYLGGLDTAIEVAKELADLSDEDISLVVVPRPKTLFERLFEENRVSVPPFGRLLGVDSTGLLDLGAVERWLRQAARPQVQVRMTDVVLD